MSKAVERWKVFDAPNPDVRSAAPAGPCSDEVLLAVDGVHCAACVRRLRSVLGTRVNELNVDLPSRTLEFRHDPQQVPLSTLLTALDDAGFAPQVLAQDMDHGAEVRARRNALARIGVAAIGAMQVMMLAWPAYVGVTDMPADIAGLLGWAQLVIAGFVVFYAGWPMLRGGWQSLASRVPTMDLPVAASLLIAWGASSWRVVTGSGDLYFDAATMFVLLLGLGRHLESRTRARAGDRLRRLAGQRVLTTLRETGAGTETVTAGSLRIGDVVRIAPGDTLPADAVLLDAQALLDESLLSGESRPVAHPQNSQLLAGSLNAGAGLIRARVVAIGSETRLSQIVRLLRQASLDKPRAQLLADRIAGHFVLAIVLLAGAGAAAWWLHSGRVDDALDVALAVLVVSCPCALSLAMPAVFAAASDQLARRGVLLARPAALARIRDVDTVLFDKTGTLTRAQLHLAGVKLLAARDAAHCLRIATALEAELQHPIAQAFRNAVPGAPSAQRVLIDTRGGISGRIDADDYWLGAPERAQAWDPAWRALIAAEPDCTWLLLADAERALALFALRAELRPEAETVIAALHRQHLQIELLTGDSDASAAALAGPLGIQRVRARQTPEQKLARLRALQAEGRVVMAVGDGINDAPFLAAADVAVAMPAGAPLAQARADAILVGDSLAGLMDLRGVARHAQQRVHENMAWALGYNLAMLPLALSHALTPWLAALGMSLSSLIVVANALRVSPTELPCKRSTC